MIIDFRNKKALLIDDPSRKWHDLEQSEKGHFILDLLGPSDVEQAFANTDDKEQGLDSESSTDADPVEQESSDEAEIAEMQTSLTDDNLLVRALLGDTRISDHAPECDDTLTDEHSKMLEEARAVWFNDVEVLHKYRDKKKLLWEVFADEGRTSVMASFLCRTWKC